MEKWLPYLTIAGLAAAIFGFIFLEHSICVNWYAPWMLGTEDPQAIAYFCSPKGGK